MNKINVYLCVLFEKKRKKRKQEKIDVYIETSERIILPFILRAHKFTRCHVILHQRSP